MWNSTCSKIPYRRDRGSLSPACGQDRAQRSLFGERRGFGLIEVVIAIFLTTVGIMAVMSMQPTAWQAAARADYLGRAAEILSRELEARQAQILNPCNAVTTGTLPVATVLASGQAAAVAGDAVYSVTTTITSIGTNIFRVTVTVNWNFNKSSVTESIVVTRQGFFRFPTGCTSA
jgi:hypothetical protein